MNYKVINLESIDSTNVYLKNLCSADKPEEGTVILADYQTQGKGQGTNSWHSSPGLNITMSILFKPSIRVSDHFCLSEFISLGIVDTLTAFSISSLIKWPNDIYTGDRKIAGILVENSIQGNNIFKTIAGIGLNINEVDFPLHIPNPVSMKMIQQKSFDRLDILETLLGNILKRYEQVCRQNNISLHEEYNQLLYRKDQISGFIHRDVTFQATISEVDKTGELILKMSDGQIKRYLHGEVSFII